MGMQDRDYYREWLREKHGWGPSRSTRIKRKLWGPKRIMKGWHPVLIVIVWLFIGSIVYGLVKILTRLF